MHRRGPGASPANWKYTVKESESGPGRERARVGSRIGRSCRKAAQLGGFLESVRFDLFGHGVRVNPEGRDLRCRGATSVDFAYDVPRLGNAASPKVDRRMTRAQAEAHGPGPWKIITAKRARWPNPVR